jgi:MtN3 and saliva related transmembrane protein
MYSAFTLGIALWLGYGVMLQAWPVVIANAITFVLAAAILVMKIDDSEARIDRARTDCSARA